MTISIREGQCDNNRAGRNNANDIDLNRNFPRQFDEPVARLKVCNGHFRFESQKKIQFDEPIIALLSITSCFLRLEEILAAMD